MKIKYNTRALLHFKADTLKKSTSIRTEEIPVPIQTTSKLPKRIMTE